MVASDVHRLHAGFELHDGAFVESFESPFRADVIAAALRSAGHDFRTPEPVDLDLLRRVHTAEYVDFLANAWRRWVERGEAGPAAMGHTWPARGFSDRRPDDLIGQLGYHSFAADSTIVDGTWTAAAESAALATTAADLVADGAGVAYALCRPPGHHAMRDQFGGYCYLANSAIAAQRLLDRGMDTVAVLDVDYHHGNGTQQIFEDRADVFTISIHADPVDEFPWFSGFADETGTAGGEGRNLNLPLPRHTDMEEWMAALDVALDRLRGAGVDALVVALGVDTHVDDPLGTFRLETHDFTEAARRVARLDRPTVVVQEGGYANDALGTNVGAFLDGLG